MDITSLKIIDLVQSNPDLLDDGQRYDIELDIEIHFAKDLGEDKIIKSLP